MSDCSCKKNNGSTSNVDSDTDKSILEKINYGDIILRLILFMLILFVSPIIYLIILIMVFKHVVLKQVINIKETMNFINKNFKKKEEDDDFGDDIKEIEVDTDNNK